MIKRIRDNSESPPSRAFFKKHRYLGFKIVKTLSNFSHKHKYINYSSKVIPSGINFH